jgi:hypothetical protein
MAFVDRRTEAAPHAPGLRGLTIHLGHSNGHASVIRVMRPTLRRHRSARATLANRRRAAGRLLVRLPRPPTSPRRLGLLIGLGASAPCGHVDQVERGSRESRAGSV